MFTHSNKKITNQTGSVAIELTFVVGALAMCMMFAGDLAAKMTIQGELDNLSYSMANIVRDRTALYSHADNVREELSRQDAEQIDRIVRSNLTRQRAGFNNDKYAVIVEGVTFDSASNVNTPATVKQLKSFHLGNKQLNCNPPPSSEFKALTPYTNKKRYMPMYRVTICYESPNLFYTFSGAEEGALVIQSSSINVGR